VCKKINLIWLNKNGLYIPLQPALAKDFNPVITEAATVKGFSGISSISNLKSKIVNPPKSLFLAVYSHFYSKTF